MDWFRSWHGAPTDPKWLSVARKAGVAPGVVSAIVWALFDEASQADDRGCVDGFDAETYSDFSGFDEQDIRAVMNALEDKGVIVDGRLHAWEKRQVRKEDVTATERKRKQRAREAEAIAEGVTSRDKAERHAASRDVTTDKIRGEENNRDANASLSEPEVPTEPTVRKKSLRTSYPDDFEAFWREYPTDALMSKKQAAQAWSRLSQDDRDACVRSIPAFKAYCSQHPDYRPVHAVRYITHRRFDSFDEVVAKGASRVSVKVSDLRFPSLAGRFAREYGKRCPVVDGGWSFPVEWLDQLNLEGTR